MKQLHYFVVLLFVLAVNSFATFVAVLETGADAKAKDSVSLSDRQYLTNVLREQAVLELPATQNYTIMTRENIMQMLPPGKAIEDCEGSCLVETGKNISADYVCQARVGRFGSSLTLSAELYETAGNKLIASFNGRGQNVEELLELIERKSSAFFRVIRDMVPPSAVSEFIPVVADTVVEEKRESSQDIQINKVVEKTDSVVTLASEIYDEQDEKKNELLEVSEAEIAENNAVKEINVGESIPANVNADVIENSTKKSGIHWVPLGISAVATVTGVVLAVVGNNKAKDVSKKKYSTTAEFKKYYDEAKSWQTVRGIGVGVAIAGTLGIGFSIAF